MAMIDLQQYTQDLAQIRKSLIAAGDALQIKVYRAPGILDTSGNENAPDGEYVDLEVTLAVVDETAA